MSDGYAFGEQPFEPQFEPVAAPSGSGGDGLTIALAMFAVMGLLVTILVLWFTRCDVGVLDRLVEALPGAWIAGRS